MHKELKFCTTKEAVDETRFAPHPFHGVAQFMPQMWDIEAAPVAQFAPFELLPEPLPRIQLWGIRRERLEVEAVGSPIGQKFLDSMAAVGVDNLTAPLYRLSPTWHTRSTQAAPHERSALFPHSRVLAWSCHEALSLDESV